MLTVQNIHKRYGPVKVLLGAGFSIAKGQKFALVGPNGVGKSTLLRILAGVEEQDRGVIERGKNLRVSYLPQEFVTESAEETVIDYLRRVSGVSALEAELESLENRLGDEKALVRYGELRDLYDRLGGFSFDRKARHAADGLGLRHIASDRKLSEMSGGQRRRLSLAGALLEESDLLLLDEPTNDLDLPAILWLERFLRKTGSAVIVASHDRAFLDAVSEKVLELDWYFRTARVWTGNYSTYFKEKSEELRREHDERARTDEERIRLRETAEEKIEWAKLGAEYKMPDKDKMSQGFHRDRSQQKQGAMARALNTRADHVKKVVLAPERDRLSIFFDPADGEERGIVLSSATAGYDGGFRVGPIDMDIPYPSRIGIFGKNGAGKSTLLRLITGELPPLSGTVSRGESVRLGVLSQGNDFLPKEKTAYEWFAEATPITEAIDIIRFLDRFLLNASALSFPMGELSPGERMRLALGFLMATKADVLILDEPTNHLDLEAVAALSDALRLFPGTLILVSHDRAFLSGIEFSQVFSVDDGACVREEGYAPYLERAMEEARRGE
ncbi:MAG: ABC-F family ATP-binding cassette domain-containing protein [Candidatus Moranbacteria bacterium]|nr:ABC-F family ATP-binding cassette domain-containing protein [Candidatus Moranbacteria bacterium]